MKFNKMIFFIKNQKQSEILVKLLYYDDATVKKRVYIIMSRGIDNRIVLKMLGSCAVIRQSNDSIFSSDMIDSRQNVEMFAVLVTDREWRYFYNHTCNLQDHFGTTSLRIWLSEKLEQLTLNSSLDEADYEDLRNSLHLATVVQIIRTRFKVTKMYMGCIIASQEHPVGKIERYWLRWEYQDGKGNLSHIHCIIWTTRSNTFFSEDTLLQ